MSSIDARRAHQARESRRKHQQQRQTVIFGSLIAGLLVLGLAGGAIWVGILPAPVSIPIHTPEPDETVVPPPCPPEGAEPVPLDDIAAHVMNGTNTAGLAATTANALAERGVSIGDEDNALSSYEGVAQVTTGPTGVAAAYTIARHFSEAEIRLDSRAEDTITVVVGSGYSQELVPVDEIPEIDVLEPLPGCTEVIIDDGGDEDGDGGDEGDGEGDS